MPTTTLHVTFADEEYERLIEEKGDRNWSQAILEEFGVKYE